MFKLEVCWEPQDNITTRLLFIISRINVIVTGFTNVAADLSMVHVVSQFPGQAFLISKSFYDKEIKDKESKCCSQR